jgi:hypothetical protein
VRMASLRLGHPSTTLTPRQLHPPKDYAVLDTSARCKTVNQPTVGASGAWICRGVVTVIVPSVHHAMIAPHLAVAAPADSKWYQILFLVPGGLLPG